MVDGYGQDYVDARCHKCPARFDSIGTLREHIANEHPREHTTVTEFYSGSMLGRVWMGYRAVQTASITQAELDGLGIDAAAWFASAKYHGDFESIDDFQYSRTERRVTVLINPVTDAIIGMDTEERTRVIREESEDWPSPFDDDESEED